MSKKWNRNPVGQGNSRGNERMIDLHGLHVSEALQVLKHELSVLRSTARATQERLQIYICVGTGHHTRGSRTPARLPVAVQRYLLEEEGLDYSEPQAGLLRVIIYWQTKARYLYRIQDRKRKQKKGKVTTLFICCIWSVHGKRGERD
jgi:hypothetical protein